MGPVKWVQRCLCSVFIQVKLGNFEQITECNESTGSPVIWTLLFAFVLLEFLNAYLCFIFYTNVLAYNLLFFITFALTLHLDEFMKVFPLFGAS